ncbi:hypothetical protein A0J61_10672, partial [Choanephora cucurbitarum]
MPNTQENPPLQSNNVLIEMIHSYLESASRPTLSLFCTANLDFVKDFASNNTLWHQIISSCYKNECATLSKRYLKGDWRKMQNAINRENV